MFILWDETGNKIQDEYPPEERKNLLEVEEVSLDFDRGRVVASVEALGSGKVLDIQELGDNHYKVLDIRTSGGHSYIVRIASVRGVIDVAQLPEKLRRECEMMNWVASASTITIPKLYCSVLEATRPYMVSSKCEGTNLADSFGALSSEAKSRNISMYAEWAIQMFRTASPQKIGSVDTFTGSGARNMRSKLPSIGPMLVGDGTQRPNGPFGSIAEYFSWLVLRKLNIARTNQTSYIKECEQVLSQLETFLLQACKRFGPSFLRTVPCHEDLVAHNVFCDQTGSITGIIDWEFHSVKPALLAVSYPSWITYSGFDSPQFCIKNPTFDRFWFASPAEAADLRKHYDSIVRKKDLDYYRMLKDDDAEVCRQIEKWLRDDSLDPGFGYFQEWFKTVKDS